MSKKGCYGRKYQNTHNRILEAFKIKLKEIANSLNISKDCVGHTVHEYLCTSVFFLLSEDNVRWKKICTNEEVIIATEVERFQNFEMMTAKKNVKAKVKIFLIGTKFFVSFRFLVEQKSR